MKIVLFFVMVLLVASANAQINNRKIDSIYASGNQAYRKADWKAALQNFYIAEYLYKNAYVPRKNAQQVLPLTNAIAYCLSKMTQPVSVRPNTGTIRACDTCPHR